MTTFGTSATSRVRCGTPDAHLSEDEITDDTDWRISEWGYDDPAERAAFLNGPTLEELTKKLREEVGTSIKAREERAAKAEKEKMFKNVGRNDPCPCGSGKKFKKCCGKDW